MLDSFFAAQEQLISAPQTLVLKDSSCLSNEGRSTNLKRQRYSTGPNSAKAQTVRRFRHFPAGSST
eukprot:752923-Hanusia_phi.AAC.1